MKIEVGGVFPAYFQPAYPEEFQLFSHFEVTAASPLPCSPSLPGRRTACPTCASTHGAASTGTGPPFSP